LKAICSYDDNDATSVEKNDTKLWDEALKTQDLK
jgi:hypothetical protein